MESTGRPSGDAYAEFTSEEIANQAMGFHKKMLGHRYVELFRSSVSELVSALGQRQDGKASFGGGGGGGSFGGGGGSFGGGGGGSRGGVEVENSMCIRMQGIPFNSTEGDLTRFFQDAGVTPVRIHRKQNGGEAYVEFSSIGDARQATTLDKQNIGRRYIELFRVSYQEMAEIVGLPPQHPQHPPQYNPSPPPPFGGGWQNPPPMGGWPF